MNKRETKIEKEGRKGNSLSTSCNIFLNSQDTARAACSIVLEEDGGIGASAYIAGTVSAFDGAVDRSGKG